jgi:hypothetical protein
MDILINSIIGIINTLVGIWSYFFKPRPEPPLPPLKSDNFKSQLGHPDNSFEPSTYTLGKNPFIANGSALSANSPVFCGREKELAEIWGVLLRSENAGSVSIVGEDKTGKSSLLNRIYQQLAAQEKTISIYTTMSAWQFSRQPDFFAHLHHAICQALSLNNVASIDNYEDLRDFIRAYAQKGYHFVLLIDEFGKMVDKKQFDNEFFGNIRALGDDADYHFSFVLTSRKSLKTICEENDALGSEFWNFFQVQTLGLLEETVAKSCLIQAMKCTLGISNRLNKMAEDILTLSGRQPFFIQIVASAYWQAYQSKQRRIDPEAIYYSQLLPHFKALWRHRSETEQQILWAIAAGEWVKRNSYVVDLQLRGLLTEDRQLFSTRFRDFIQKETSL